jgi:hypothetical protein
MDYQESMNWQEKWIAHLTPFTSSKSSMDCAQEWRFFTSYSNESESLRLVQAARALLETLKKEKLVLDWRKRQQSRSAVRLCIE